MTIVREMYPPEDVECLTDLTYAAMASGFRWGYTVDRHGVRIVDMRRRLLTLDENTDSRSCNPQLLGWLRQGTTALETSRTKLDKGITITIRMLGPISLWDCRLDSAVLDYQTANRMIPIRMSDDPAVLQDIMALTTSSDLWGMAQVYPGTRPQPQRLDRVCRSTRIRSAGPACCCHYPWAPCPLGRPYSHQRDCMAA